jgi:hypothetical protein
MGFVQKVHCHSPQVLFTAALAQWIKTVPHTSGIKDQNRATLQPVGGGEVKEIALNVVDDDGVGKGEKLTDR